MSNNSVGSTRSRKSSNENNNSGKTNGSSKGWFEGTMEVISGMDVVSGLVPRPSTPVANPNLKRRPSHNNNNARGSMSAPNSPARSASGASAFFPLINRLPSQDSMDRSIHNESSTHGKSASQIIRELKQSNASLSAKTAAMEADFMNQLNHQNRKAEERQRRLEETVKKSEKLLVVLETRCKTAESTLRERDEQLTKMREEGAFQRHTISDLRNQMHQYELQQEKHDYEQRDEVDKWLVEKQRMEQEMEDLRAQVQDSQVLQKEVERLNHKLEDLKMTSSVPKPIPSGGGDDDSVHSQMGSSQRSSYTHRSFMKQSLPQTRDILKKTKHRLSVTEAALDILKQERARMMHEHQVEVEEMQQHMEAAEQAHKEREEALQRTIQVMERQRQQPNGSRSVKIEGDGEASFEPDDEASGALRSELETAQQAIANLKEQVRQYEAQVSDLSSKLEKFKVDAENQEQYRADEAEDLRVLHDAQEEEIERLRKEVDDLSRELELRDQELEEQKLAMENSDNLEKEKGPVGDVDAENEAEKEAQANAVADLKQRLKDSETAIERLEAELDSNRREHHDRVEHLERVLHETTEGKEDAEEQLAQLSAVLVVQKRSRNAPLTRSLADSSEDEEDDQPLLPRDGGTAVDLTIMLRSVEQLQESERMAVARVKQLEYVEAELEELRNSRQSETQELEELVARLKESEEKLSSTRDGAMEEYRVEIQKLRSQLKAKDSQRVQELTEQVREARAALNDVRKDKTALIEEHKSKVSQLEAEKQILQQEIELVTSDKAGMIEQQINSLKQLENDKNILEADFSSRIQARDSEISDLRNSINQATNDLEKLRAQNHSLEQEKQALLDNHKDAMDQLRNEKEMIESQRQGKDSEMSSLFATASSSSTGEPTSDSDQVAVLKQEIEKLQKQLLEEQVEQQQRQPASDELSDRRVRQSGGALEADLCKQLEAVQRERNAETNALKEKLEDRDTTISALVKSSVGLEQKISQLTLELQTLRSDGPAVDRTTTTAGISHNDEEVAELREALADYKNVENRLIRELSLAKKQLKFSESEIARLQEVMDDEVSCDDQHYRRQIQERDDAVSALVQQSMSQESEIQKLQNQVQRTSSELESMRAEKQRTAVQLRAELRRLHQESEIFAGQIIEQDEELEALRSQLRNRNERIESLNRQLKAARGPNYRPGMMTPNGETPEVVSLNAQIDELEEANQTYRTELRELRFKLRDYENLQSDLLRARDELEEFQHKERSLTGAHGDLEAAIQARYEAEQQLEELQASQEASNRAADMLAREKDALVMQRDRVIEELRRNIDGCTSQIEALETEIDTLNAGLKDKTAALEQAEAKVKKLEVQATDNYRSVSSPTEAHENTALFEEIEHLQQQVKDLENENEKVAAFKKQMTEVEAIQEQSQKLSETYERKLSLLALDKDTTIDSLQKSLIEIKSQAAEDFEAMTRDMKRLDSENQTMRREMEAVLKEKDSQISTLLQTLDAQEQLVGTMKSEMDHLQGSMVHNVHNRREEIEDMEKEVLDLTTKNAAFEREITSLKMQLEENKLAYMAELAKLKETVESLSHKSPPSPIAKQKSPLDDFPIHEVKDRLEKLRLRNNSIQEENFKLKSRLEKAEAEIQTARNDKYRTATLEAKVGALTKQLEKLESEHQATYGASKKAVVSGQENPPAVAAQPLAKMTPPQTPKRQSLLSRSLPGSRSSSPVRTSGYNDSTPQRRASQGLLPSSRPGSRQATPQRKRTPLRPTQSAQKAPDTPSGRKRSLFGFGKKNKDRENEVAPQPTKQYLVPPTNPPAPKSEKILKAPISSKSIQSAS